MVILNWIKGLGNPNFKSKIKSQVARDIFEHVFLNKVGYILPPLLAGLLNSYYTLSLVPFTSLCIFILSILAVITHPALARVVLALFNVDQTWLQFTSWLEETLHASSTPTGRLRGKLKEESIYASYIPTAGIQG